MERFIFIGGDARMRYAAEYLDKERECAAGNSCSIDPEAPFDAAVLPLPIKPDFDLSLLDGAVKRGGRVFAGGSFPALEEYCAAHELTLHNYLAREELQVLNAVPTAEGALEILIRELDITLWGSQTLITGFGRIGEVMARMLAALGSHVTVCARRPEQLAKAEGMGCKTVFFSEELDRLLPRFDAVINTVPAVVLDEKRLLLVKKGCLIVDLASKPGTQTVGTAAGTRTVGTQTGAKIIHALSLPGKTAPITAGKIIGKTIENILREEEVNGGDKS